MTDQQTDIQPHRPADPRVIPVADLARLLNVAEEKIREHVAAGALRFGDGTHIHLVRYVRWLIDELDRPRPQKIDYAEGRGRQEERNQAATLR